MRNLLMLVVVLAGVAFAQVPVTRLQHDTEVRLPYGALLIDEDRCESLAENFNAPGSDCYMWLNADHSLTYQSLVWAFEAAGYESLAEQVLTPTREVEARAVVHGFSRGDTIYGIVVIFSPDSILVIAYPHR